MNDKPTLSTLANGAVEELFQAALQAVLANINDINTPAEAVRGITVALSFKPNEERDLATIGVQVSHKSAGARGTATMLFIQPRKVDGKFIAVEHNPKQMMIEEAITPPAKPAESKV